MHLSGVQMDSAMVFVIMLQSFLELQSGGFSGSANA
jgi:hypothetical protein